MNRQLGHELMVVGVVGALVTCLCVANAGEEKTDKPARKRARGTIESFNPQKHTVTVKVTTTNKKKKTSSISNETFRIADDCKFMGKDKKKATLADFKVGDEVNVTYDDQPGTPVAHVISIAASDTGKEKTD